MRTWINYIFGRNIKYCLFLILSIFIIAIKPASLEAFGESLGEDFNWNFLNGSQEGIYGLTNPEDLKLTVVSSLKISSPYHQDNNIPNVVVNGDILYSLDKDNNLIQVNLTTMEVVNRQKLLKTHFKAGTSGIAFSEGYIYIGFEDGQYLSYSTFTNSIQWRDSLATPINSAPIVDENKIYMVSNNNVYAINTNNGEVLWTVRGSQSGVSFKKLYSPVIYKDYVMVGLSSSDFMLISKANGELAWKKNLSGSIFSGTLEKNPTLGDIKSSALAFADKALVMANNKISLLSLSDKSTLWQDNSLGSYNNTVLYNNSVILVDNFGSLVSLNLQNGNHNWKVNLSSYTNSKVKVYWNNPLIVNENIVISNSIGDIFLISLSTKKVIKQIKLYQNKKEKIYYSPAITKYGLVFLSSQGFLYFLQ